MKQTDKFILKLFYQITLFDLEHETVLKCVMWALVVMYITRNHNLIRNKDHFNSYIRFQEVLYFPEINKDVCIVLTQIPDTHCDL